MHLVKAIYQIYLILNERSNDMFKPKEAIIPLRRSELISPNGVGAITTNTDGINLMPGALDNWFDVLPNIKIEDFEIEENRLNTIFQVDKFRIPPDYRVPISKWQNKTDFNLNLQIPMIRFPNWYYCSHCRCMSKQPDFNKDSRITCKNCDKRFARLIQVPLIVACENGHLDDFPWVEWVHKELNPTCDGVLKLKSTGGATLSTMRIECTKCNANRNLKGLTTTSNNLLSENLSKQGIFKCTGRKPWFGSNHDNQACDCIPQPILKNATNAYYPEVLNAIYIPVSDKIKVNRIVELYNEASIKNKINRYNSKSYSDLELVEELLVDFPDKLGNYNQNDLIEALQLFNSDSKIQSSSEINLKLEEYNFLNSDDEINYSNRLRVIPEYNKLLSSKFYKEFGISKVNLIPKLVETRVLYGFTRLTEPTALSVNPELIIQNGKKQLFRNPEQNNWLPAYQVFGEGIYIEFDNEILNKWEEININSLRFKKLDERLRNASYNGVNVKEDINPRYVLLHTLAHLFIQEIVVSSGYSSSSLKERIYVGKNIDSYMNGFLIYTASGDSEGTMGGLVRLGKEDILNRILGKVIENAVWCSSDPVCNEIGIDKGQGRDYLNGAACHNCSYTSEISCEEFNKYLDRGLISSYETSSDFISYFHFIQKIK